MNDYVDIARMLALGLAAGLLSGLFGIGGGLVIVPALVILFGFPPKVAVGTSLFVILFPTGLLGVIEYWKAGNIRPMAGLWVALGVFVGAYFGALYAGFISQATMKRLYACFLLAVAVYFFIAPSPAASKAEAAAKPVPPEAVGGPPAPDAHRESPRMPSPSGERGIGAPE
jgi:uncharacterized membrane protein YfcA